MTIGLTGTISIIVILFISLISLITFNIFIVVIIPIKVQSFVHVGIPRIHIKQFMLIWVRIKII